MTTAPSLLDQLRAQQPAPTNGGVMLSPEQQAQMAALPDEQRKQLESLIANPPQGMQPQKVVEMVLAQAQQNAPAPAPAAEQAAADARAQAGTAALLVSGPRVTEAEADARAGTSTSRKANKADRTKLIVACAAGGLSVGQANEYLDLLG